MNRCLAFLFAVLLASITISSACVAQPSDWIRFTLEPERGNGELKASFRHDENGRGENHWSSGFKPSELIGLKAGRLDCSGTGGGSHAAGNCRFTANPAFTQLLTSRGIGRPSQEQAFG